MSISGREGSQGAGFVFTCLGVTLFECGDPSPLSVVCRVSWRAESPTRNNRQRRRIAALKKSHTQTTKTCHFCCWASRFKNSRYDSRYSGGGAPRPSLRRPFL